MLYLTQNTPVHITTCLSKQSRYKLGLWFSPGITNSIISNPSQAHDYFTHHNTRLLTLTLLTWTIWRAPTNASKWRMGFNPLNAELNPIRHLLALVAARHIVHVSRIRVNTYCFTTATTVRCKSLNITLCLLCQSCFKYIEK